MKRKAVLRAWNSPCPDGKKVKRNLFTRLRTATALMKKIKKTEEKNNEKKLKETCSQGSELPLL